MAGRSQILPGVVSAEVFLLEFFRLFGGRTKECHQEQKNIRFIFHWHINLFHVSGGYDLQSLIIKFLLIAENLLMDLACFITFNRFITMTITIIIIIIRFIAFKFFN